MGARAWMVGGLLGAAVLGCARGPVYAVEPEDPGAVASARTLAVAGGEPAVVLSPVYDEARWPGFPDQALALLATHGFRAADADHADLWLRAHLLFKRTAGGGRAGGRGGARTGGGHGGGQGGGRRHGEGGEGARPEASPREGGGDGMRPSREVKVVLELLDRATQRRVWTGSVAATLQEDPFTPEGRLELDRLLDRLATRLRGPAGPR